MEDFQPTYTVRGIIPGKVYQDLVLDFIDEKGRQDFTVVLIQTGESFQHMVPTLTREDVYAPY